MTPEDQKFYAAMGKRIAESRKAVGLTQVQLAEMLGVSQQTIAHYEGGRLRLVASLIPEMASALGKTSLEIMGEGKVPDRANGKRGPASKLEQQIEQIRLMPRTKQKFISQMLEALIQQQQAS